MKPKVPSHSVNMGHLLVQFYLNLHFKLCILQDIKLLKVRLPPCPGLPGLEKPGSGSGCPACAEAFFEWDLSLPKTNDDLAWLEHAWIKKICYQTWTDKVVLHPGFVSWRSTLFWSTAHGKSRWRLKSESYQPCFAATWFKPGSLAQRLVWNCAVNMPMPGEEAFNLDSLMYRLLQMGCPKVGDWDHSQTQRGCPSIPEPLSFQKSPGDGLHHPLCLVDLDFWQLRGLVQ